MADGKYLPPNWAQSVIAQAVGVYSEDTVVEMEDDRHIVFKGHKSGKIFCVNKKTGNVVEG